MRILSVHNFYQQSGGEDTVFNTEKKILRDNGHEVIAYTDSNHRITELSYIKTAIHTVWAQDSYRNILDLLDKTQIDIVHIHNTFLLISPSVYYACKKASVPVVQTLHNYRLLCPAATFFRKNNVCESCLDKFLPWPGIFHACYRNSLPQSSIVASMLAYHRLLRTWQKHVDQFIALTEFAKQKFITGGFEPEKLSVKPNCITPDPGIGEGKENYIIFVGRLSSEKGLETLIESWEYIKKTNIYLKIVGNGPLSQKINAFAQQYPTVEWLDNQPRDCVLQLMKNAKALVVPSIWFEGFPMVIAEAFAVGLPIIASNIGGLSTIIKSGCTGLHFNPGNPRELAKKIDWAFSNPNALLQMRNKVRLEFEETFSSEKNYQKLLSIYENALQKKREIEYYMHHFTIYTNPSKILKLSPKL